MYLAIILGLCALTAVPASGALQGQLVWLLQETEPGQDAPPPESQKPSQENPPSGPAAEPSQPGEGNKTEPAGPSQAPPPETTPVAPNEQPKAAEGKTEPPTKAAKPKRRRKHTAVSKTESAPEKKVVRNGGTGDPVVQLAPGMSQEQASRQRQTTSQMLASTETNLKQISLRTPDAGQQDSVKQIRKYMEQAQTAEKAGDVERAKNLASKALLLSEELAKR